MQVKVRVKLTKDLEAITEEHKRNQNSNTSGRVFAAPLALMCLYTSSDELDTYGMSS